MAKYSIKDLERFSGIKAHTLRIWEKRYNLLEPKRTDTNIRYYSDEDLKKLLNVSLLCNSGEKISKIAVLTNEEMCEAVRALEDGELLTEKKIDDFIRAMLDLDEQAFNQTFDELIEEIGFQQTLLEVVFPFLRKVGILWLSDDIQPTHEHFTSNLIRNKMIAAIHALPFVEEGRKGVLFLPEGEFHELGLVLFNFILRKHGVKTYYLGQSTPIAEVNAMVKAVNADFVITYTLINCLEETSSIIDRLEEIADNAKVYFFELKHQESCKMEYPKGVQKITTINELLDKEGLAV